MSSISALVSLSVHLPTPNPISEENIPVAPAPTSSSDEFGPGDTTAQLSQSQSDSEAETPGRADPTTIKSKIDDLIATSVQSGKLSADQAAELNHLFSELKQLIGRDGSHGHRGHHGHRDPDRDTELNKQLFGALKQLLGYQAHHHHQVHNGDASQDATDAAEGSGSSQTLSFLVNISNGSASSIQDGTASSANDVGNSVPISNDNTSTDNVSTLSTTNVGSPVGIGASIQNVLSDFLKLVQDSQSLLANYSSTGSTSSKSSPGLSLFVNYTA